MASSLSSDGISVHRFSSIPCRFCLVLQNDMKRKSLLCLILFGSLRAMARILMDGVHMVLQNILFCMGTLVDVCWFCVDMVCGNVVSIGCDNAGITFEMQLKYPTRKWNQREKTVSNVLNLKTLLHIWISATDSQNTHKS